MPTAAVRAGSPSCPTAPASASSPSARPSPASPRASSPRRSPSSAPGSCKTSSAWLKREPALLGEELRIVASQLSAFDRTRDRPDLLAVDRAGKLVVIEIKRDDSGSGQDLQALRYGAYVSTLDAQQVAGLYRAYEQAEHARELSAAQARLELDEWVVDGDLDALDADEQPRVVLIAGGFQVGVTNTALWLSRNFGLDITCVQLVPHRVGGEVVLASTVLIPLPEVADFEVRLQAKRRRAAGRGPARKLDLDAARAFIASIPTGRWASYGDVAAAIGRPDAGQPDRYVAVEQGRRRAARLPRAQPLR